MNVTIIIQMTLRYTPIGFAVISTFGSVGATATAFLTNYEIPLRIIAIAILAITYFTTVKSLKVECKLNH